MNAQILFVVMVGVYLLFWIIRAITRIYFHPLSRYPGSKLAAASASWYEWYWNFHHPGQLLFEIERQHQIHGPVIRIGPSDLHINDPEIFLDVTRVGSKFTKDPKFYNFCTFPGTSIGETDPNVHRIRRQVLAPAFSPQRVQELAPFVKGQVDKLLSRFSILAGSDKPVNFHAASKAFTMDVISKFLFGQELGCMDDEDFRNDFVRYMKEAFEMGWTATAFPGLTKTMLAVPDWLSKAIFPIPILVFKEKCTMLIAEYLQRKKDISLDNSRSEDDNKSVVIDLLLDPTSAKGHVPPSPSQLTEEIIMLLSAGNDTTSDALILGIWHILRNTHVLQRLETELKDEFPDIRNTDAITYANARNLPYLNAVIKEILRISNPLPGRLPRLVPPEGYNLYGQHIPGGVALNFSIHLLNRHPSVWSPHPQAFNPDRWLTAADTSSLVDKYLTTFYNGTRGCLGKQLAWCEMYVLLANLFRRFEVQIYDTSEADMEWIDLLLVQYVDDVYVRGFSWVADLIDSFKGRPLRLVVREKCV